MYLRTAIVAASLLTWSTATGQCNTVRADIPGILGQPTGTSVFELTAMPNGDMYLGGLFQGVDGTLANSIARWDGSSWHPLGAGTDNLVQSILPMANGDLVIGGLFTQAGGAPANKVARWDGNAWTSMSTPDSGDWVYKLVELSNGDLIAGGILLMDNMARWDGTGWVPMGAGLNELVWDLTELPDGRLVAAGAFTATGSLPAHGLAVWDGTAWAGMNGGLRAGTACERLLQHADGTLLAGGYFRLADGSDHDGVAAWNGNAWQPYGDNLPSDATALVDLPGGDIAVGIRTTGSPALRWNGSAWVDLGAPPMQNLNSMTVDRDGVLWYGGYDILTGPMLQAGVGTFTSTCPADVVPLGNGCVGSGGQLTLTANDRPWTGQTFVANASGLPANAVVLAMTGLNQRSVPLSVVHPLGGAGCNLLATGDAILFTPSSGGVAQSTIPIPAWSSLAGLNVHHQHFVFELDAAGQLTGMTVTNALTLTVGTF